MKDLTLIPELLPLRSCIGCVVLSGVITLQLVYIFSQQPSLIPLLTVCAFCPKCERFPGINKFLRKIRWVACAVLSIWLGSLLTIPLFEDKFAPFFISGDISLFWYVILAPPSYSSISYIITAAYTSFAAVVGSFIIYGISRNEKREEELGAAS